MENTNFKSASEYANCIIDGIAESEASLSDAHKLDVAILSYWYDEITSQAEKLWLEYLAHKRESFMFYPDEFEQTFQTAVDNFTNNVLESLADRGFINIKAVNEKGDLLFGISELGEKAILDFDEFVKVMEKQPKSK